MNERIKELLTEAGFCLWQDEEWGPGPGNIDWGPDYSKEFNLFIDLFLKDILNLCGDEILSQYYLGNGDGQDAIHALKSRIQDRYGLK
jgi:hypothetical protein